VTKKTPPAYGLSDGPIIVACQWNISSATGPVKGQRHAFKSDFDTLKLQYQFFIQADESFTTQLKTVLHCVHTEACWSCQCHSSILMAKHSEGLYAQALRLPWSMESTFNLNFLKKHFI